MEKKSAKEPKFPDAFAKNIFCLPDHLVAVFHAVMSLHAKIRHPALGRLDHVLALHAAPEP
jgi:hypothetical protein